MTDEQTVEQVAMEMAFSIRQPFDVSRDAQEHWSFIGSSARCSWRQASSAAIAAMQPEITAAEARGREKGLREAVKLSDKLHGKDDYYSPHDIGLHILALINPAQEPTP